MMTDPLYYLVQFIFFPLAAVVFGLFLNALVHEITTSGWELSPRCVWRWCLTVSSFFFCIMELDPCSVLGILPTAWRNGVECTVASVILNSASSTFYMYIIVLSKRHLSKASSPSLITNPTLWIVSCVLATVANIIVALGGAITDNGFWFGISLFIVAAQELILLAVVNVTLHKMGSLLSELEAQTSMNYTMQRRKIWIIRIVITALIVIDISNEFTKDDSYLNGLFNPAPPLGYDPTVFDPSAPILSVLMALAHLVLLYAMQRPSDSSRPSSAVVVLTSSTAERPSKLSVTSGERPSKSVGGGTPNIGGGEARLSKSVVATPNMSGAPRLSQSVVVPPGAAERPGAKLSIIVVTEKRMTM